MSWYYKHDDQEIGPISKAELTALVKSRQINGATLVRHVSKDNWKPLAQMVKPKKPGPGQPSAPPPQEAVKPVPPPPPPADDTADAGEVDSEMPFQFTGTGGGYFKIWIVNILLSIVTLGIYSAWAKVRRKQYFYGNTRVSGSTFRYLADPLNILKGRLIVAGGFLVFYIVNQTIPPAAFVVSIAFLFLLPWLAVRSLCFNARNSSWRQIRFNFLGTYGQAFKAFVLFPILSVLTIGILAPYAYYRQRKFVVENSAYGTTDFSFHATAGDYYRLVLLFLIPVAIAAALMAGAAILLPPAAPAVIGIIGLGMYLYAFAYFNVKSSNLLYNSGGLQRHRFKATMAMGSFAWILITNVLGVVFTLGFFHPVAQVRAYRYKIEHLALLPQGNLSQFVAAELKETSALGDEVSDFMDFDFGL